MARDPIAGGYFETNTADIRALPDAEFLERLESRGYEAAVAEENGDLRGVGAFQRFKREWHCFLFLSMPEDAGQGRRCCVRSCKKPRTSAYRECISGPEIISVNYLPRMPRE